MNELTLVGRRIFGVAIDSEQQHYLRFTTDKGEVFFGADGDCCSESWFSQITGLQALLFGVVNAQESVDMPEQPDDGRSRQDSDRYYGIKLTTNRGHCDIEFRNSSNGYYGGSFSVGSEVYGLDKVTWRALTSDYP